MYKTDLLPCLPLRDIVVFPGMLVPLFVGREKSIKALKEVMKTNKKIILVTQKNPEIDDPEEENLYPLGCESKILQLLKLPDGTVKVLVEGLNRIKILECKNDMDFMKTSGEVVVDIFDTKEDLLPFAIAIIRKVEKLTNLNKKIPSDLLNSLKEQKNASKIADHISAQLNISIPEKQKLLETLDLKKRLSVQKNIIVKFDSIPNANHFFKGKVKDLANSIER